MVKLDTKRKKIYLALVVVFIVVASACAYLTYLVLRTEKQIVVKPNTELGESLVLSPQEAPNDNQINILLIGHGGEGHSGGTLADTLMLLSINTETKQVFLISVPRDTYVSLPVEVNKFERYKINESYAIGADDKRHPNKDPRYTGPAGAGEMAKYATEIVTGLDVHYFASVDFNNFAKSIDLLDGVTVDVPVTFDDFYYPIKGQEDNICGFSPEKMEAIHATASGFILEKQFTCRYEHLHFNAEPTLMDGTTALKFVRSRHSDQHGGDFARSQRQQALLLAIRNKLISTNALANIDELFDIFSRTVRTDINLGTAKEILQKSGDLKGYEIKFIGLTKDNVLTETYNNLGQYILQPKAGQDNFTQVHSYIQKELSDD